MQANEELSQSRGRLVEALAELQKSHAKLQATQWRLIEATKLESIGRLAAGVAHAVKNPLMALTMAKKRTLTIDGEPNITRTTKMNLKRTGAYTVGTENHPLHVVAAARELQADLVLLDVMMTDNVSCPEHGGSLSHTARGPRTVFA
jgi:PleD family two-component response regulator